MQSPDKDFQEGYDQGDEFVIELVDELESVEGEFTLEE